MISNIIKSAGLDWILLLNPKVIGDDFLAGFAGAAVVLPQAIAFASIAGLPPEFGIYTAIVTTIVAAFFGSSLLMVSGPTTAISILVFSAISPIAPIGSARFIETAISLSFLVGIFQIFFAVCRVGLIADIISHPVMLGFTSAAAIHIFLSQIPLAFGQATSSAGIRYLFEGPFSEVSHESFIAFISTVLTMSFLFFIRSLFPRFTPFLPALLFGSVLVFLLGGSTEKLPYVKLNSVGLPDLVVPNIGNIFDWHILKSGLLIALIGMLEAIAIGRTLGYRSNSAFNANKETFGQGLSNAIGSLFQCYPGSGSFTRSAFNAEAGAKTPLSAIVSSLCLVIFILFFSWVFDFIPLNIIAGLIIYIAIRLVDLSEIYKIFKGDWIGKSGFLGTLISGILINLEVSIFLGVAIVQGMKVIKSGFR